MSWDQAAQTAAIRVKPTEEWEIELIGERTWEVAFIEGARWQRKHAGEEASDNPTNRDRLELVIWANADLDLTSTQVVAKALDKAGVTAPEEK